MFVFGFAADVRGGDAASRRVRAMMAERGGEPDAVAVINAPHAAAGLARWSVSARDERAAPIWDAERQWLVTGDVRLYNRAELISGLRADLHDPDPPDLELAWRAYARWGREVSRRLIGDFAFIVWDEQARSLFAIRDHLGVRPLLRHETSEGFVLASDVRQILYLLPSAAGSVDDYRILDRFMGRTTSYQRTHFRSIALVRPGHYLEVEGGHTREVRYWYPPDPDEGMSYTAHCEAVRAMFERAVRDRLDSDRPIVAHSSGGYDSTSILMVADKAYAAGPARPPLVMASALTPGMPADESHFMDAVARRVRFEAFRWNAVDESSMAHLDSPSLVHPGLGRGPGGGPQTDFELARARGARVLLTGHLGDTVMFAWGLRPDLFRHGRWRSLVRETIGRNGLREGGWQFVRAGLGVLPPETALTLGERAFNRAKPQPPWFGPRLQAIYSTLPRALDTLGRDWPSHLACELWGRVTSAQASVCIDAPVQGAADTGLEVRMPYTDVRLIERVLRIPAAERIKRGSVWALRHDALGGMMPGEFRTRPRQPSWGPTFALAARRAFPRVAGLLADGDWLSAPYSDRNGVAGLLADLTRQGEAAPMKDCIMVADLGAVEAWIRQLLRYDSRPRWRDE
jgi:asparagine synthase (glutamine-hydrolysing)